MSHSGRFRYKFLITSFGLVFQFYLNPSRFPFAWQNHLDIDALKSVAFEEEKERGPNQTVMMRVKYEFKTFEQSSFTSVHLCVEIEII